VLIVYGLHELAPERWASAVATLRRFVVVTPPLATAPADATRKRVPRAAGDGGSPPATLEERGPRPMATPAPEGMEGTLLTRWAPLAIVVLAFALRVIDITGSPYGFFCDEASNALDAYWLLHTLHDQHGVLLPAFFEALGPQDWRGGLSIYWDVPFTALFGLSEFTVRFAAAVAGTLTVWLTYIYVDKAFKNRLLALLSAFVLAITPWHIMTSRIGFEWITVPLMIAVCLVLFYLSLERPRLLPLVFVAAALGVYTHFSGRAFFPLFMFALMIIYAPFFIRNLRETAIGVVAGGIVLIPTAFAVRDGTFFAHFNQVAGGAPQSLGDQIATFWANYQAHFETGFLFQTTDYVLRHFVRGFGMLYPIEAPFLIIGLIVVLVRHRRADLVLLAWLLLYPVAASLVSPPLLSRSIPGVIVLAILAAQGLYTTLQGVAWGVRHLAIAPALRRGVSFALAGVVVLVGLGATADFMKAYLVDYPTYSSGWWGWQWGPQKIVPYFEAHRTQYAQELWDAEANSPDELLRFYTTPDTGQCPQCGITNVADPASVSAQYLPNSPELWAVNPDIFQTSSLRLLPHRIVGQLYFPGGQVAYLFVATGPQVKRA
jgi:4-amino-4-deoxy-L-arabinose transferase-like glycosyltransferase